LAGWLADDTIGVQVSDEDKETKKKVQDELLERFEEGLAHTMRPVTPLSVPSGRLFRLLLYVLDLCDTLAF
jgi:hypothetical protein